MVSNTQPTPRGSVSDLVNNLLDRGYNQSVQPVLQAIQRSTNSGIIAQRLNELDAEAQRLAEAGERLRPDNPVLRALLADMESTLAGNAQLVNGVSEDLQSAAINAAGTIQRQLALPGTTDAQLARIGLVWNRPDPEAVARLINYANSPAFAATLQAYPQQILDVVRNQAIRGIAQGWSPRRTAREIRRTTQALPAHVANNLARTLQLTAYRDATAAHQQANLDICQQIIRIAALDQRTCLSCIALHGTVIWDSERDGGSAPVPRVDDHHSGRCTSVMRVKGRELNIQSGPEWFDNLPPDRQRMQASFLQSPGKWDAFTTGKVTWPDFVHAYQDPAFGQMLREASLSDALSRNSATASNPAQVNASSTASPLDREYALNRIRTAGLDAEQFETDIYNWRLLDYQYIREAQTSDISEWNDPNEYRELIRAGNNIEAGLRVLPNYTGTIYRALDLENLEDLRGGRAEIGAILQMEATSSFTRSSESKFVRYSDEYNVILRSNRNQSAVAVENIGQTSNSQGEFEVIVPSQTTYRITGIISRASLPATDPLFSNSGWVIDLEEIE